MIQATNAQIRRLFNEKMQAEEELQECKERVKNHIAKIIEQRKLAKLMFHLTYLIHQIDDGLNTVIAL